MSALTTTTLPTMTSREIAELTGKEHKHILRDARAMLDQLGLSEQGYAQNWTDPQNGQTYPMLALPKDLTITLVAGYSVVMRHRIVTRWQELEEQARNPIASLSRIDLLKLALDSEEKRLQLEQKVETMQITVAAHERLAKADGSVCITNAAKDLQMRPKDLFAWMTANQWIYRRPGGSGWLAYQSRIQVGYLEHKVTTVSRGDGSEKVVEQVLVTSKGLARLAERLSEHPSERKAQPVGAADT